MTVQFQPEPPTEAPTEAQLTKAIEWCRHMCHEGDNMCNQQVPCYIEDEKTLAALRKEPARD